MTSNIVRVCVLLYTFLITHWTKHGIFFVPRVNAQTYSHTTHTQLSDRLFPYIIHPRRHKGNVDKLNNTKNVELSRIHLVRIHIQNQNKNFRNRRSMQTYSTEICVSHVPCENESQECQRNTHKAMRIVFHLDGTLFRYFFFPADRFLPQFPRAIDLNSSNALVNRVVCVRAMTAPANTEAKMGGENGIVSNWINS